MSAQQSGSESHGFVSALLTALERGQGAPRRADSTQWIGWLDGAQRRGEFRQSERDWLELDGWLKAQDSLGGKSALRDLVDDGHMLSPGECRRIAENPGLVAAQISREHLVTYVRQHQVELREVTLGGIRNDVDDWELRPNGPADFDVIDGNGEVVESGFLARASAKEFMEKERLSMEATKFHDHQLPGGERYRELLLLLKDAPPALPAGFQVFCAPDGSWRAISPNGSGSFGATRDQVIERACAQAGVPDTTFQSSHFDYDNILAHVRFNERTDDAGARVLFVEEIQSDWHQKGRREGYRSQPQEMWVLRDHGGRMVRRCLLSEEEEAKAIAADKFTLAREVVTDVVLGVPDAPLKGTDEWAMLAFKRMVRWAAENGFDRVGWTTGEQQADRYDLSKQVSSIAYERLASGDYDIKVRSKSANEVVWENQSASLDEIEEYVGKELAAKIESGTGFKTRRTTYLEGLDLKVGGEGMAAFYDKILPAAVNKWAKKFGASVIEMPVCAVEEGADLFEVVLPNGKIVQSTQLKKHALATASCFADATVREVDKNVVVHGMDVTPAMRDAALGGLPMFKREVADVIEQEEDNEHATFQF